MRFYSNLTRPNRNLQSLQTLQNDFCCQQLWKKKSSYFCQKTIWRESLGDFYRIWNLLWRSYLREATTLRAFLNILLEGKAGTCLWRALTWEMLHFRCAYNLMQTLQLGIAKSNNPDAHSCFDFHVIHLKLKFRSKDQQKNFLIERHSISLRAFCGRITYGKVRGRRTLFLAEC